MKAHTGQTDERQQKTYMVSDCLPSQYGGVKREWQSAGASDGREEQRESTLVFQQLILYIRDKEMYVNNTTPAQVT